MSAAKFHVGQQVKRVAEFSNAVNYRKGDIFTITRISSDSFVYDENNSAHWHRNIAPLEPKPQTDLSDIIKVVQAALDEYSFKQNANTARIATHLMQGLIVKIGGVE